MDNHRLNPAMVCTTGQLVRGYIFPWGGQGSWRFSSDPESGH